MASKEELYVSLDPELYRKNKSNNLSTQADLLKVLKHFQNLKVLARQKNDLKKRLHKLIISIQSNMDHLQDKLPTPKLPKSLQKEEKKVIQHITEEIVKNDSINNELQEIQEKLRKLNG